MNETDSPLESITLSTKYLTEDELTKKTIELIEISNLNSQDDPLEHNFKKENPDNMSNDLQCLEFIDCPIDDQLENNFNIENSDNMSDDLQCLELIDCKIELMDQFKLTDHIDLCNNDIHLNEQDIFGDQIICNIDEVDTTGSSTDFTFDQTACSVIDGLNEIVQQPPISNKLLKKKKNLSEDRQLAKVNENTGNIVVDMDVDEISCSTISFTHWLDSIIERINVTMDFNGNGQPDVLVFSVHHVSTSFIYSVGPYLIFLNFIFIFLI